MKNNNLPNDIPVFPLSGAIFFPRTVLPLNIFEDRYIQLVKDCVKEKKFFGMVQPKIKFSEKPEVYSVGCLGKIVTFNETNDKRFVISLLGVARFKIKEELNTEKLYRKFNVDYSDFAEDLNFKKNETINYNKNSLLKKINLFLKKINYEVDSTELFKLNFDQLISTICMISPFSNVEKQKLIEEIKVENKLRVLEEIINFHLIDFQENKTIQ
jgi:Lon protease-like protein|tara:strand:- start:216 stop:854 length:639 start_codon:yes stop_codon:yes gene_type:complete